MEKDNLKPDEQNSEESKKQPEIIVNDYGTTKDSTVVIEEDDRTVMLTEDETVIIEKTPKAWGVVPKNRPRKVYGGMWGQAEIITVGLSVLAILATVVLYMFFVMPAQKELETNKAQRNKIEEELISVRGKYGSITDKRSQADKLVESVNNFEGNYLPSEIQGKSALYERLNGLISSYGLVNTSGPNYTPLEVVDPQRTQQAAETGRDKLRSLFPGEYITVTVEGSYQNLRAFIKQIEMSQQFIMISAVELVPAENQNENKAADPSLPPGANGQIPAENAERLGDVYRGKVHGERVSLKLDMAAYFRRPNFTPFNTQVSIR